MPECHLERVLFLYRYGKLFGQLDKHGYSYGITDTSLEEIFLNVAQTNQDDEKKQKKCKKLWIILIANCRYAIITVYSL